jgi:predicted transporter
MERPHPRFTIADTLKALGILVVVYFVLGALITWAVEPRYPTVFRWSAVAVTFVFLIFVLMGLSELLQALWWRSGSRDRRKKNR